MTIIFLDVDGVLCSLRSHKAFGRGSLMLEWDPTSCALIARLCREFKAQLVVSSTWRHDQHAKHLRPRLKKHGLQKFLHQDWKTPDLRRGLQFWTKRGLEIEAWLAAHPGVDRYCIVDDSPDMLPSQERHFCHVVNDYEGFGFLNWREAKTILGLAREPEPAKG